MNIYMYIYHIIYHTIRLYTILDLTLLKPFLCSLYLVIMERKLNHPPPLPPPSSQEALLFQLSGRRDGEHWGGEGPEEVWGGKIPFMGGERERLILPPLMKNDLHRNPALIHNSPIRLRNPVGSFYTLVQQGYSTLMQTSKG